MPIPSLEPPAFWRQVLQFFGFKKRLLAGGGKGERQDQDRVSGWFTRFLLQLLFKG